MSPITRLNSTVSSIDTISSEGSSPPQIGAKDKMTLSQAQGILLKAQAVCFDVDSTVIPEEGIDELASFQGAGEAVAEWTARLD